MAINLDPAQGASMPPAGRLDRRDAEARQDRWMTELERAMFSTGAKKQRTGLPRQAEAPAQQETVRPDGADVGPAIAGRRAAGTAPAAASAAAADGRGAEAPQAASGPSGPAPGVPAAHDALEEPIITATQAGNQGGTTAGVSLPGHALAGALPVAAAGAAAGAVVAASVAAPGASAGLAAAAGSGRESFVQTVQAVQQATAMPAAFGQAAEPLPEGGTPAEPGLDMAEPAGSGAPALADTAEFDKRLMHLFAGPDGMHAYIRDAELGAAQIRSVAAALGTELAASGQALTTLTVNGKRIGLTSRNASGTAFDADGAPLAAGDQPAGSQPLLQSLSLVRKEPSE